MNAVDLGSDARNYNSDLNVEELTRRAKIFCWNCHHDACIDTLIVERKNPCFVMAVGPQTFISLIAKLVIRET